MINKNKYFSPSTNLKADIGNKSLIENIIVTKQITSIVNLYSGYNNELKNDAVSIVGPYGSGKSTTAVFLYHYLTDTLPKSATLALKNKKIRFIENKFKKNEVKIIVGTKSSLEKSLKKEFNIKSNLIDFIKNEKIAKNKKLILLIDEFGKYLEYSSDDPKSGDVYVLQELAELASRSNGLFKIITIRHQAIMGYFSGLRGSFLNEWKKIQGRFHDLVHSNTIEDTFELIAPHLERWSINKKKQVFNIDSILKENSSIGEIIHNKTFRNSYPLHPYSILLLISAYKRFAQNERSVFTFLNTHERHSLKYFIDQKPDAYYCLDNFYDYIFHNLSHYLIESSFYQDWNKIEVALKDLNRSRNKILIACSKDTQKLIKIIGILDLFGNDVGLRADIETLSVSIYLSFSKKNITKIQNIILALQEDNIITQNLFQGGSFHLWHGAHTNINELIQKTIEGQKGNIDLAKQLNRISPNEPFISKKHLIEKGTCRSVELRYQSIVEIDERKDTTFDGLVLLFLASNYNQKKNLFLKLSDYPFRDNERPMIIQIPSKVENYIRQYIAISYIEQNNDNLRNDKIGRQELLTLKNQLSNNIDSIVRNHFVYNVKLYWKSLKEFNSITYKSLSTSLTNEWFEKLFPQTPLIKNELVNVMKPSPSAMTGVKKLLIEMLKYPHIENFNIETNGPEKSIYINLLKKTGLHRKSDEKFILGKPSDHALIILWETWDEMIENTRDENDRIKISDLIEKAIQPPFGLKVGLAHILSIIKVFSDLNKISVYHKRHMEQEFMYLAKIETDTIHLLSKRPENFEVKYVDSKIHQSLFAELYYYLNQEQKDITTLLDVARSIINKISVLKDRTVKTKKGISQKAQDFIKEVRDARSPEDLIYIKIPKSLGLDTVTSKKISNKEYIDKMHLILEEIQTFEANIFPTIKEQLIGVWDLGIRTDCTISEAKTSLNKKLNIMVLSWIFDEKVKEFVKRSLDDKRNGGAWLESVSSHLVGKLPEKWSDDDIPIFIDQLRFMKIQYEEAEYLHIKNKATKEEIETDTSIIEEKFDKLVNELGITENEKQIALIRLFNKYVRSEKEN